MRPSGTTRTSWFKLFTSTLLLLAWGGAQAQSVCTLVPVPLAERVHHATLVVEGRVASQQAMRQPDGHLVTRHELEVFKVFGGQLPAGPVQVYTPGGVLGSAAEVVSGALTLQVDQQGIFLLAPDRRQPTQLQAYAGPQGFIGYDLATRTAREPFTRYSAISTELYPALASLLGQPYQTVRPNPALASAQARAPRPAASRLAALPVVSSFSPATVTAGTSTANSTAPDGILTLNGSGFKAQRGTGRVAFSNVDGTSAEARPLEGDYLLWTDTQIQVRVPGGGFGSTAGTGPVSVVNSDGDQAWASPNLTVRYSLLNIKYADSYGITLVSPAAGRGYELRYAANVPGAARAPFAAAVATWHCQAGANLQLAGATSRGNEAVPNGESAVCFGDAGAGYLAYAASYYTSCVVNNEVRWDLTEVDYLFDADTDWSYAEAAAPGPTQFDFVGVALHELGHGAQLGHLLSSTGVMNTYSYYAQPRRSLDVDSDLAGAAFVTARSVQPGAPCFGSPYVPSYAGCPRFIDLLALTASYAPGQGTTLRWTTASEQQSAYFAVESLDPSAVIWEEVVRQPAAGTSTTPRPYAALDARQLTRARYYRLRQVGLDGTPAYSRPVLVQGAPATEFVAYPNPAAHQVHLSGPLVPGADARVQVLDALGRPVGLFSSPYNQPEFDLPLTSLAAGCYTLVWYGGAAPRRQRLLVE